MFIFTAVIHFVQQRLFRTLNINLLNGTTIKQLAKELNLSAGSVSKALKDSHEISSETKQKVLALAAKYHYTPNPYASSLRKRKSKTIAVVLPEVADSFFAGH